MLEISIGRFDAEIVDILAVIERPDVCTQSNHACIRVDVEWKVVIH